jgi:hypothetical protein
MREEVQDDYGRPLTGGADLHTSACCDQTPPEPLKPRLARSCHEVLTRHDGRGRVAPAALEGKRILDPGSGRDVHPLSALVGERAEATAANDGSGC